MIYGTDKTKPEAMPKLIAERKLTFPVLLDPDRAYREAMHMTVYPTATLLDRGGHVVWQGQTFRRQRFADACEEQIEAVLAEESAEAAAPARR